MLKLTIPDELKIEFGTVESLWRSGAETRRTDALLLAWVKYEKQLRRLFCFLVFQHPSISEASIDEVISAMAQNRNLSPDTFVSGIAALGVRSVPDILGADHGRLWPKMQNIKLIRNKLMHGQITGQGVRSPQLERDVLTIIDWVTCLARAAHSAYGYDGLKRNTYRVAKASTIAVDVYPFATVPEFKNWLTETAKPPARRLTRCCSRRAADAVDSFAKR